MGARTRWVRHTLVGVALAVGLGACGDDVRPGFLLVTFESPSVEVGAVVVELAGAGLGAVQGVGGAVAVAHDQPDASLRVLTSSTGPVAPRFRIAVDNVNMDLPRATLLQAVDLQNRPVVGTAGVQIRIGPER